MLAILEAIEKTLKAQKVSSSSCDKVISQAPSYLKVFRSSSTLELTAVLSSIKETILNEKITIMLCDCSSLYNMDKVVFNHLYTTLADLPQACNVAVILACYILTDMPSIKMPRSADICWSLNRRTGCHGKYTLTSKHKSGSEETEYTL